MLAQGPKPALSAPARRAATFALLWVFFVAGASARCSETDPITATNTPPAGLDWTYWESTSDADALGEYSEADQGSSKEASTDGDATTEAQLEVDGGAEIDSAESGDDAQADGEPGDEGADGLIGDADPLAEPGEALSEALVEATDDAIESSEQDDSSELLSESTTELDPGTCTTDEDCLGLETADCPGWWTCDELCQWSCPSPLDLWSLHDLHDDEQLLPETTALGELVHDDSLFQITELRLRSFEWADGEKAPISVRGFIAVPLSGLGVKPAVILLHGLTSTASAEAAMSVAGQLDAVVLSLNGPGQGGSLGTGPGTELDVLFRSSPDPRGSWTYAYALATARAITYIRELAVVQPSRIGVMGSGLAGAVAMMVNGVDDRVRAALILEAAGDIQTGAKQGSWYTSLLAAAGLTPYAPTLNAWSAFSDPLPYAPHQRGAVLLVVGAQDEYHPVSTVATTYEAILAPEKRLTLIANWDASYYQGSSGQYGTFNNSALATTLIRDATRVWFRRFLYDDTDYADFLGEPSVHRSDDGVSTTFQAAIPGADGLALAPTVRVQYSGDGAYSFASVGLQPVVEEPGATPSATNYAVTTDIPPSVWGDHNLVYFVEARYTTGAQGDEQVLVTSEVHRYPSFSPQIRPQQ